MKSWRSFLLLGVNLTTQKYTKTNNLSIAIIFTLTKIFIKIIIFLLFFCFYIYIFSHKASFRSENDTGILYFNITNLKCICLFLIKNKAQYL